MHESISRAAGPALAIAVADPSLLVVKMLRRVSRDLETTMTWHHLDSGAAVLERLFDRQEALPSLGLVDLHLPDMLGHMVLAQIRGNRRARWLPVLMFDYAASEADVALSYAQGANAFATKPETLAGYVRFVEAIEQFWWGVARLPPDPAGLPKL